MQKTKRKWRFSLYIKFALVILAVGIVPIALLSTVIQNKMFVEYKRSLTESYEQGLRYSAYSVNALFNRYNDLSKFSYYYNYSPNGDFSYGYKNYDNLRQILTGEAFGAEKNTEILTEQEMATFLQNLLKTDSNIEAVHFLYQPDEGSTRIYHAGNYNNTVNDEDKFAQRMKISALSQTTRQLILIPTHNFDYIRSASTRTKQVFTVARNYYDQTLAVGKEKYVGTLFIDLRLNEFENVFTDLKLYDGGAIYIADQQGNCYYSTDTTLVGENLIRQKTPYKAASDNSILLVETLADQPLTIYCKLSSVPVDRQMRTVQNIMYIFIALSIGALLAGSLFFSHRLTKPLRTIMNQMSHVETGRFKGQIPVTSNDELGDLTARFNQMTTQLETYTNQVYVSRIQQTEAELTALKSQIYPHFLYNTLEVIRMTAISHQDEMVAKMVESLSDQIRYLIGTVSDLVPLKNEVDILNKYIYLINCRFDNKVDFVATCANLDNLLIPKMILQPVVENAFIHGIKPMEGRGHILLSAQPKTDCIEIIIMDNGCGMSCENTKKIQDLLDGAQPGHKNNNYQWESIGLKNVHDRLRYLYGAPYGLSIFSTSGVGTVVTLRLPLTSASEDCSYD